ncbi:hypothetical protein HanXRQr2_Chr03g0110241 [Helianthus annuus]|uniref:Uncharacterized protein n=1 Tax=Helianthus annuus TaxID=4232 RepID=A0A9K3JFX8_HELAN|nr:hypothetical protein HanXRQr2_Chr03g0110241 [Helianthus annuus]
MTAGGPCLPDGRRGRYPPNMTESIQLYRACLAKLIRGKKDF